MTREKSWRGDACTPRCERLPRALPGVLCAGREADPPGRVWAYGSMSSPEGRTDREHPTAQPALPHHPASPQPRPQRQEKAESSGESVSQVGTLGLSIALHPKGLAESPLKPLVLKLVGSLVLINEHSPGQGRKNGEPCELEGGALCQVPSSSLRTGQWACGALGPAPGGGHCEPVSHLPQPERLAQPRRLEMGQAAGQ